MTRAAATPMVEVSTTNVVRRSGAATSARATCSDTAPSGRLSTTASARRCHVVERADEGSAVGAALGAGDVMGDDLVTGRHEVGRQHTAHVAQPDEADRHRQLPCCSARTARIARLAAFPAGAPQ